MLEQVDLRLEQARRLIQAKQTREARSLLLSILQQSPHDTRALYLYAHVARNRDEAQKVLQRVLDLDPFNYHAKVALNKLLQRSVEQIAPTTQTEGASKRTVYYVTAAVVVLVLAGIGILSILLMDSANDEDALAVVVETDTPAVATEDTSEATPTASQRAVAAVTLPPTWTPVPSNTSPPTRTPGPTFSVRPSQTPRPTYTPTVAEVAMVIPSLSNFSRLYFEYLELSAQVTWTEDVETLERLEEALRVMIASLQLYDYDSDIDNPTWVSYVEEFITLLDQEKSFAATRRNLLELQAELTRAKDEEDRQTLASQIDELNDEIANLSRRRLIQQETVDIALRSLTRDATSTVTTSERIDELKTPSSTPIIIPTATLSS